MSISNYYEDAIMTQLATDATHVSLHTGDPGETGANEVAGGSYARQAVTWGAVSGGAMSNSAALDFTSMPACTVTHAALWDDVSAGNCLWSGTATNKTLGAGDTYQVAIGDLDVAVD